MGRRQREGARRLAWLPRAGDESAAVARSGFEDGEQAPRDVMVVAAGRIAHAVDLPVTADLEAGYGDLSTARAARDAGLVGINFEDSPADTLLPIDEQVAHIEAIAPLCRRS
jgi:2-methylisocitrate lyase-like PEP mutase family enzyme